VFYRWQQECFKNGEGAFEPKGKEQETLIRPNDYTHMLRTQKPAEKCCTLMVAVREDERKALEFHGLSDLLENHGPPDTHHHELEDDGEEEPTTQ
jgi:hypothetical protein